jgi:hypothetical protein
VDATKLSILIGCALRRRRKRSGALALRGAASSKSFVASKNQKLRLVVAWRLGSGSYVGGVLAGGVGPKVTKVGSVFSLAAAREALKLIKSLMFFS